MSIDNNITSSIEEKIKEAKENDEISKILIKWLDEIDDGKKDIDTEKVIQELIDKIKWVQKFKI